MDGVVITSEQEPTTNQPQVVPAATAKRGGMLRFVLGPFIFARRRPLRTLSLVFLTVLVVVATIAAGVFFWASYHLRAARNAVERGHSLQASEHLRKFRSIRPDYPESLLLAARVTRRQGLWIESGNILDRYVELHGEDDSLVLERLMLRATQGELEESRPLLQLRIDHGGPDGELAREALITGLLYSFRTEEARQLVEQWLAAAPNHPIAILLEGKVNEHREKPSEAMFSYRRLVELDPENDEARLRMTTLLLDMSQGDEALPHLEYLLRRMPNHPAVRTQLGQALDLQGRVDEARSVLDECLKRFPNHAAALAERGRIASRDGDNQLAEDYLRGAIQLDPSNNRARYQLYLALNKSRKTSEALKEKQLLDDMQEDTKRIGEIVRGEIQRRPNNPEIYYEIAMISLRAGQPADTLRWLKKALHVGPNHMPTHRALAALYIELGNPVLSARHRAIAERLSVPRSK